MSLACRVAGRLEVDLPPLRIEPLGQNSGHRQLLVRMPRPVGLVVRDKEGATRGDGIGQGVEDVVSHGGGDVEVLGGYKVEAAGRWRPLGEISLDPCDGLVDGRFLCGVPRAVDRNARKVDGRDTPSLGRQPDCINAFAAAGVEGSPRFQPPRELLQVTSRWTTSSGVFFVVELPERPVEFLGHGDLPFADVHLNLAHRRPQ